MRKRDYRLFIITPAVWICTLTTVVFERNLPHVLTGISINLLIFFSLCLFVFWIAYLCVKVIPENSNKKRQSRKRIPSEKLNEISKPDRQQTVNGINRFVRKYKNQTATVAVLLFTSLLCFSVASCTAERRNTVLYGNATGNFVKTHKTADVIGKVISNPLKNKKSFEEYRTCSVNLEGIYVKVSSVYYPNSAYVKYTGPEDVCKIKYDSIVKVSGKLDTNKSGGREAITVKYEKSSKNSYEELSSDGIYSLGNKIRSDFSGLIENEDISIDSKGLILGMSTGDKTILDDKLKADFQSSSLSHLLAVSGSHFAIIISLICSLCALFRLPRFIGFIVRFLAILGFVLTVHPEDSVSRAAFMSIIAMNGFIVKRPSQALSALSTTIIVLLFADPYRSISYAFALSCCTTAAIVIFSAKTEETLSLYIGDFFASVFAVPICAWLGSVPLILLMTSYISPYGIIANVSVMPAIILLIPLSFFTAVFLAIKNFFFTAEGITPSVVTSSAGENANALNTAIPDFANQISDIPRFALEFIIDSMIRSASVLADYTANISHFVASFPYAKIEISNKFLGISVAVICLILLITHEKIYDFAYEKLKGYSPSDYNRIRHIAFRKRKAGIKKIKKILCSLRGDFRDYPVRFSLCCMCFILPVSLFSFAVYTVVGKANDKTNWIAASCNVGQADAGLIRTSRHGAIMIDVGREPSAAKSCLDKFQITHIDLLVLSHFHNDHVGGLDGVINTPIDRVFVSKAKPNNTETNNVMSKLKKKNIPIFTPEEADTGEITGDMRRVNYTILSDYLPKEYESSLDSDEMSQSKKSIVLNNASVSILIKSERVGFSGKGDTNVGNASGNEISSSRPEDETKIYALFLGDLEYDGQQRAFASIKKTGVSRIDYLKVAHHGSKKQLRAFAEYIRPAVAVYSVGKDNSFSHPNKQTVDLFNGLNSKSLRTDYGDVGIRVADNKLALFY